uniref:Secreted protein n=1 Tax=Anabas testudineus TaxID=64144 RepID=A0A3Q1J6E3_ANATE
MCREFVSGLFLSSLLPSVVCNTEVATGFNTSALKEVAHGKQDNGHQGGHSGPNMPHSRGRRNSMNPAHHNPPQPPQSCTLYGVFQLPSHLACNNGETPSSNICGIPCSSELTFVSYLLYKSLSLGLILKKNCRKFKNAAVVVTFKPKCHRGCFAFFRFSP